jgi:hypothetical protein
MNFLAQPDTDPTSIYRQRDGLYAVDMLTAAICHLDLFSFLAEQPADLPACAARWTCANAPPTSCSRC